MKYLTTKQAAERLGTTDRNVRLLIRNNKLRATKVGRDWIIAEFDLQKFLRKYKKRT